MLFSSDDNYIIIMSDKFNLKLGLFYLIISLFLFVQYFLFHNYSNDIFSCSEYVPFIASSIIVNNWFITIYSIIANISFQFFGLLSYIITLFIFIRGILIFFNINKKKKYQFIFTLIFVLSGTVILNIISTYPVFKKILQISKLDYYAGGYIGYALSKIIFIDILKQNALYGWQVTILFIVWLWSIQYVCLFNYKLDISKLFSRLHKVLKNKKLKIREQIIKQNKVYDKSTNKTKLNLIANYKKDKNVVDSYSDKIHEKQYNKNLDNTVTEKSNIQYNNNMKSYKNNTEQYNNTGQYLDNSNTYDFDQYNTNKHVSNNGEYILPDISLLDKPKVLLNNIDEQGDETEFEQQSCANELLKVLEEFSVHGEIIKVTKGPVVTMFEFKPAPGTKNARVISLSDDIARSMQVSTTRISAIPGKNALGIELPNQQRQTVYLSELIGQKEFIDNKQGISLILGKNISGDAILSDLTKMPHVLIAGTTGSGKSVSINCMILSILFKFKPEDCKLIMIDPKMLELSVYDDIPHLLTPVVVDPKKAVFALQWVVSEMENRYKQMSKLGVRNIESFNQRLKDAKEKPQLLVKRIQVGFNPKTGTPIFETQKFDFDPMPYIVVVVDEVADLMLVAGKEVESAIQRLAQMARAAGIHLIIATQRPSVDVITGTIKANFPTRISFQVTSKIDSRTILGEQGAEQLLGQGDMLYMSGAGRVLRVHGPFVSDMEVDRVVDFIRRQCLPKYDDVITKQFNKLNSVENNKNNGKESIDDIINNNNSNNDDLYDQCSVTYIQRKLQIGYNRAARIIEEMESNGIVSPPNQNGKREILI